ncbi:hypothetical protein T484DRAFT_1749072 [Baffinella frigidus]|nr:hypothetical protein T484DRAFT_1749072 [Cryptophyta sp. CCMP2293]
MQTRKKLKHNKVEESTESEVFTMPPGKYYVGDLCYVLGDKAHDELCKMCWPEGRFASDGTFAKGIHGKTILSDGRTVVSWECPYGDGAYEDQNGRFYMVDSGWLGITLLEGLEEQWEHPHPGTCPKETMMELIKRLGHIVECDSACIVKNVTVDYCEEPGKKGAYRVVHMSFGDKVSSRAGSGRPIF